MKARTEEGTIANSGGLESRGTDKGHDGRKKLSIWSLSQRKETRVAVRAAE